MWFPVLRSGRELPNDPLWIAWGSSCRTSNAAKTLTTCGVAWFAPGRAPACRGCGCRGRRGAAARPSRHHGRSVRPARRRTGVGGPPQLARRRRSSPARSGARTRACASRAGSTTRRAQDHRAPHRNAEQHHRLPGSGARHLHERVEQRLHRRRVQLAHRPDRSHLRGSLGEGTTRPARRTPARAISRTSMGAHALHFNVDTIGIGLMGDYSSSRVRAARWSKR